MRRFAGERVKNFIMRLTDAMDHPIEHRWISKSIAQAQTRVEGYHFDIRKRVLEYDDVVNKQRHATYRQRDEILESEADTLREKIQEMIAEEIEELCNIYLQLVDAEGEPVETEFEELYRQALTIFPVPEHITPETLAKIEDPEDIQVELLKGALQVYQSNIEEIGGSEKMTEIEKYAILRAIDDLWVRHLTDLDVLREGIGLQAIRQRDPLVEYKIEAYNMWEGMQAEIQNIAVRNIYRAAFIQQQQRQITNIRESQPSITSNGGEPSKPEPVRASAKDKIGRNDPCWCGSGKKYKSCHYREDQADRSVSRDHKKQPVGSRSRRR
jgi:preprotein translocase subunit SecA